MEKYRNFTVSAYVHAHYAQQKSFDEIRSDIDFFCAHMPPGKVYVESHRALVDVSEDRLCAVKHLFEENGFHVAGGITTNGKVGSGKPSIFDCFCYSDPAHRNRLLDIVRLTARVFDEFILDDFYFAPCRCEMCIRAKGKRTWKQFRLEQMEQFSRELVAAAKAVNPKCKTVIKFPNWYESFAECGYHPEKEIDIFDGIFTGTETRQSNFDAQHLQRYLSYAMVRWLENAAPGRNGGGWIDQGGAGTNGNIWLEQADLTLFAKARELMLFNFEGMIHSTNFAALAVELQRVDRILDCLGNPVGVAAYEPHHAQGEDQLLSYIGMLGIPLEPKPYFDASAPVVFLTQNSTEDELVMEKLERYVREGGIAIVTNGFLSATLDKGITDMTSVRPTNRKIQGTHYQLTNRNISTGFIHVASEPAYFSAMTHKTNATWFDVLLHVNDFSTAILTEDHYGRGFLYILNIPDNFGDLYRLPREVVGALGKDFARGGKMFLSVPPKYNLFMYDNDVFGVYNLNEFRSDGEVIILGEEYKGFADIETGKVYDSPVRVNPQPCLTGENATFRPEPLEKVYTLPVEPGRYKFFRLLK